MLRADRAAQREFAARPDCQPGGEASLWRAIQQVSQIP